MNKRCESIDKLSGTAKFYIPPKYPLISDKNNNINTSNDDNHAETNNKPHYTEYFPKMNFKKGMLDLKESAIEENLVKPLQSIGNNVDQIKRGFVNKIRGKSGDSTAEKGL